MHAFHRTCRLVAVSFALASHAGAQTSGLQHLLDAELARFPGRAGIWVRHLTTGDSAAVRADEAFNSASVIKIPILALAFEMADRERLSLADRVTITADDRRGGSGIFRYHDPGLQPTMRDVLLQMVITSDNTATDLALGKMGGVDAVNGWLRTNGYGDVFHHTTTTAQLFSLYGQLPQGANPTDRN